MRGNKNLQMPKKQKQKQNKSGHDKVTIKDCNSVDTNNSFPKCV